MFALHEQGLEDMNTLKKNVKALFEEQCGQIKDLIYHIPGCLFDNNPSSIELWHCYMNLVKEVGKIIRDKNIN